MYQILITDSDERHLKKIKKILEVVPKEYVFYYASTPEMSLSVLEKQEIDVFICELELPVMSGEEMFALCNHISPNTIKIALSPADDIKQTLASINHCRTFRLILKPCQMADDIMLAVKAALKVKQSTMAKEAGVEAKRQKLERIEQLHEKVVKQITEQKEGYGMFLDMVTGFVKNNLEMGRDSVSAKETEELQEYLRQLQESFIKYYILEPKEWKVNERLLLEEFEDASNNRILSLENHVSNDIPFAIRPNISYALYMLLQLVNTHFSKYQVSVIVMEREGNIVLSLRCNLDGSKNEQGKMCYRTKNRENFEKIYRCTVHALQWISHKMVIRQQMNPYAMDLYFKI